MTGRSDWRPMVVMLVVALVFGALIYTGVLGPGLIAGGPGDPSASPSPSPSPTVSPPDIQLAHETCCDQAARFLQVKWTSNVRVTEATLVVDPAPPFECGATVAASGLEGLFGCTGLLPGPIDHVATLTVRTAAGRFPVEHRFRTMGSRLENVKWFTEFEDPSGVPLACAAASCRIAQLYATGKDPMTATQILELGQQFNVSLDPGLDPAAIATVLDRLDPGNDYHYYRFDTREDATEWAVYWLLRSGRPVIAITLAGQHAPLVIGFQGAYGVYYDDPINSIEGVVVMDPQRGDMRPETNRRPDKYRSLEFQTGRLLLLEEWYGDEWWLRFAYAPDARVSGGPRIPIDRNDGAYPLPHWTGKFVLLVDDGDGEWPSASEGRIRFR